MKKIFYILITALVISLFSSCIIVATPEEPTYTFYFFNNDDYDIRDFYLEDEYGNTYSKKDDGYAEPVDVGEISSIKNLKAKEYRLYYQRKYSGQEFYTGYFYLDSDATYKVREKDIYSGKPRSAASAE